MHRKRRENTVKQVEEAINRLLSNSQIINFSAVSKESGVSKSSLYNIEYLRNKIVLLRERQIQNYSSKTETKDKILIHSLRRRMKKLEEENKELKKQLKYAYGSVFENITS